MNKKLIIITLVVALIGSFCLLFFSYNGYSKKFEKNNYNTENVLKNSEKINITESNQKNIEYSNARHGFKLAMPASWKDYKITEKNDGVVIALPVTDSRFRIDGELQHDLNSEKNLEQGIRVLTILVTSIETWDKYLEERTKRAEKSWFDNYPVTAKSDKNVYIVAPDEQLRKGQGIGLNDVGQYDNDVEFIRNNFTIL